MIASDILSWYKNHKRELPWRFTKNPYNIWLSEIILQQTRVIQGTPYYERFIETFPTIFDLADATEDEVLRLWQGLGYYSRGRNLHFTAKQIVNLYNGEFPESYNKLIKLKGVGPYTAAAIASICFDEPKAAIDGNVKRVISRLFKIQTSIDESETIKTITEISDRIISKESPGDFNQAVMEIGATLCTPTKPACHICPLRPHCLSFPEKAYKYIPVRTKRVEVKPRSLHYLVIEKDDLVFMKERKKNDIWKGLYDFPEFKPDNLKNLLKQFHVNNRKEYEPLTHLLTHRKLTVNFFRIQIMDEDIQMEGSWYNLKSAGKLPKPKIIADFLDKIISSPFEES